MAIIKISNWKEVVDQFGLTKAKAISKKLSFLCEPSSGLPPTTIFVPCSDQSELEAIFELTPIPYTYEFTGTIS